MNGKISSKIGLKDVLDCEKAQISRSRAARLDVEHKVSENDLIGLAFSGGGIRSATFNLGILQAFSDGKLLRHFDYLSTVSGGGYIGCWLMAWMKNAGRGIKFIEDQLASHSYSYDQLSEPKQIRFLRAFSNYLTPRKSLIGADFWTFISSYLRNTVLNLIIFTALLVSILLIPRMLNYSIVVLYQHTHVEGQLMPDPIDFGMTVAFVVAALVAVKRIRDNMGFLPDRPGGVKAFPKFTQQSSILLSIVTPLSLAAFVFVQLLHHSDEVIEVLDIPQTLVRLLLCAVLGAGIYGALWFLALYFGRAKRLHSELFQTRRWIVMSALAAGLVGGLLLVPMLKILSSAGLAADSPESSWHYSAFGPPLLISIILATATIHIGLLGSIFTDAVREWWARLGAWLILVAAAWTLLFSAAIYSPLGISHLWRQNYHRLTLTAVVTWVLHTLFGLKFGKSALVGPSKVDESGGMLSSISNPAIKKSLNLIAQLAPYVFAGGMLLLLALGISLILGSSDRLPSASTSTIVRTLYLLAGSCIVLALFASRLDVNQFSMHALYRNRLVRCYLGASNSNRDPQPFIGFDPKDDMVLNDIESTVEYDDNAEKKHDGRPLPIINTTLNVVRGRELALQTRKARSFFFTPFYCGFNRIRPDEPKVESEEPRSTAGNLAFDDFFALTSEHNSTPKPSGVLMGTAMTISGAAASPNMGYHSSPALGFLMTLFDVRLGWWMPNPQCPTWRQEGPKSGFKWLVYELLELTSDDRDYLYLSDGGHFENLGIYELVRRRCQLIVVCDVARDPDYSFGDLQIAIERCRSDFSVEIELKEEMLSPLVPSNGLSEKHFAVGRIHYSPGNKEDEGILLYLKPSLTGDEFVDIRGYPKRNPCFPHDPTSNQWFDEEHFESYRALGRHIGLEAAETIASEIHRLRSAQKTRAARA